MYDIHHHLLPGLDDGPATLDAAVSQARLALADGITHVVCTPHQNSHFAFAQPLLQERLAELRHALEAAGIPLTLALGRDFHINYENLQSIANEPRRFTINGGPYLLIELPDHGLPPTLAQTWYDLHLLGLTLILTHPERNPTLQRQPSMLVDWVRSGVLLQITAASVLGEMGKPAQRMSHDLLSKHWVHFLATDAHDTERRPPRLTAAHKLVTSHYGREYADLLCLSNPRAAFDGTPLPAQPAPLGLFPSDDDQEELFELEGGRSWWQRLLGR